MKAKVKTSELTGIALDWAVAKCEGHCLATGVFVPAWGRGEWAPSTDWAQAGPIIDRELIATTPSTEHEKSWVANTSFEGERVTKEGATSLVAAMRCYVTSRLGDEVEVPQELVALYVKMKTAELTGAALDWAVAKADGWSEEGLQDIARGDRFPEHEFSTEWRQAGPIIDREHIGVAINRGQWVAFYMTDEVNEDCWDFKLSTDGPTALIAAMRCYVAGRFGAYLEVPQELLA